ncbi:MAG: Strictosidine synthase family protein [Myxococcaceae bacterium]|nr:Strictosidine synthase family protein [Myxococcaceae bacterium]
MKPPLKPVVWTPPPRADRPPLAQLPTLKLIDLPACAEDVLVDREGRLITGLADGRIVRVDAATGALETLVNTGGRPMCIELDADHKLVVCDAVRGLLRVDLHERRVEVLVDAAVHALNLCNNAAVAADGTIYFTDSSSRFKLEHWRGDIFEHSGTGRLLQRTPDGLVKVLLEHLHFANGVALSADESYVAVAESGTYRILRYWLKGDRRGHSDVLTDDLPGFPDNMASGSDGLIWVAIASPRNPALDFLHRAPPILRRIVWALPESLLPKPERTLRVLAIDRSGRIVRDLAGLSGAFHMVTGLRVHGDKLYLASLEESSLAEVTLA